MTSLIGLIMLLQFCPATYDSYSILNFDKLLSGTDKLIYIQPPEGKVWAIVQGTTVIERPVVGAAFVLWMENAPYAPYTDPRTGKKVCLRCLTLRMEDAGLKTLFEIKGQSMPLVIRYPNRLMIAITPMHGGLDEPLMTWTRLAVVERDLDELR